MECILSSDLCAFFGLVDGSRRNCDWVKYTYEMQMKAMGYDPYDSVTQNRELRDLLKLPTGTHVNKEIVIARLFKLHCLVL